MTLAHFHGTFASGLLGNGREGLRLACLNQYGILLPDLIQRVR